MQKKRCKNSYAQKCYVRYYYVRDIYIKYKTELLVTLRGSLYKCRLTSLMGDLDCDILVHTF